MLWTTLLLAAFGASNAGASLGARAGAQIPGNTGMEECGANAEIRPVFASIATFSNPGATHIRMMYKFNLTREFTEGIGAITLTNSKTFEIVSEHSIDICKGFMGRRQKCPVSPGVYQSNATPISKGLALKNLDVNVDLFEKGKQVLCLYGGATGVRKDPRYGEPPVAGVAGDIDNEEYDDGDDGQQVLDIHWEM